MKYEVKNILFSKTRDDLNSIKIRGDQISNFLGIRCLLDNEISLEDVKAIVYIKYLPEEERLFERQKQGIIQIFDIIDNFEFKKLSKPLKYIDIIIANSISHKIILENKFSHRVEILPHHHCNFRNERILIKNSKDLVIGYIGDKTHYKKIKFLEKHFENFKSYRSFDNLVEKYKSIDVGTAWRNDKLKVKYNSNLKLINYMSFGIPSVVNYENGFSEIGSHGYNCLFAIDKEDLILNIKYLIENYDLRKKISDCAFETSKSFHISIVANKYLEFFQRL